jgi:hypothetical protein
MPRVLSSPSRAGMLGASLAVCLAITGGCQQGAARPKTVPVSGTVTLGGVPVAGAAVSFQAADGSRSSIGITDDSGRYALTTFVRGDGAVPGDYKVAISKFTQAVVESTTADGRYDPPAGPIPDPKNELPAKYVAADTSGLKATVADGPTSLDFDLAR